VNPSLVVRDENGEIYTVRYEAVNAMLLNEFLKEHRNVAEQQSTIAELKTALAQQQKQIEAHTATVRKVSERVELSAPAPQIAAFGQASKASVLLRQLLTRQSGSWRRRRPPMTAFRIFLLWRRRRRSCRVWGWRGSGR